MENVGLFLLFVVCFWAAVEDEGESMFSSLVLAVDGRKVLKAQREYIKKKESNNKTVHQIPNTTLCGLCVFVLISSEGNTRCVFVTL